MALWFPSHIIYYDCTLLPVIVNYNPLWRCKLHCLSVASHFIRKLFVIEDVYWSCSTYLWINSLEDSDISMMFPYGSFLSSELKELFTVMCLFALRRCARNQKIVGLISDGVIGIFDWLNLSSCTMNLGSAHSLTEISTRVTSWE
jgi:hypothetical protein